MDSRTNSCALNSGLATRDDNCSIPGVTSALAVSCATFFSLSFFSYVGQRCIRHPRYPHTIQIVMFHPHQLFRLGLPLPTSQHPCLSGTTILHIQLNHPLSRTSHPISAGRPRRVHPPTRAEKPPRRNQNPTIHFRLTHRPQTTLHRLRRLHSCSNPMSWLVCLTQRTSTRWRPWAA